MIVLWVSIILILLLAFGFVCHGYNRFYEKRNRLEIEIYAFNSKNLELVAVVQRLRYKHRDFDRYINDRGGRCISTDVADLIGGSEP